MLTSPPTPDEAPPLHTDTPPLLLIDEPVATKRKPLPVVAEAESVDVNLTIPADAPSEPPLVISSPELSTKMEPPRSPSSLATPPSTITAPPIDPFPALTAADPPKSQPEKPDFMLISPATSIPSPELRSRRPPEPPDPDNALTVPLVASKLEPARRDTDAD
jgi:hypothetical protein